MGLYPGILGVSNRSSDIEFGCSKSRALRIPRVSGKAQKSNFNSSHILEEATDTLMHRPL
jgi:hypothetical protein